MRHLPLLIATATSLVLAGCVEDATTAQLDQAIASCKIDIRAPKGSALPPAVAYQGQLPQDSSNHQAWIVAATTQSANGPYAVYQVDLSNKKVASVTAIAATDRAAVYAELSLRNQLFGGLQCPPCNIGPGGNGWSAVQDLLMRAELMLTAQAPIALPPQ